MDSKGLPLDCALKNHDLSVREQLDLGLRFLDFDVIYSTSIGGCDGLETGHGKHPDQGIYWCFGKISQAFLEVKSWMSVHPEEVIVLYFGELHVIGSRK